MIMFKYLSESGQPACIDVNLIIGLGQCWPSRDPRPGGTACTIIIIAEGVRVPIILPTSEPFDDLLARYEAHMAED